MHLPPEVERLLPDLLCRLGDPEVADAGAEAERIETLLLAGEPERWLAYLRERGGLLVAGATRTPPTSAGISAEELMRLAGILRDQLAMIQIAVELGPGDLALLERLEAVETAASERA